MAKLTPVLSVSWSLDPRPQLPMVQAGDISLHRCHHTLGSGLRGWHPGVASKEVNLVPQSFLALNTLIVPIIRLS